MVNLYIFFFYLFILALIIFLNFIIKKQIYKNLIINFNKDLSLNYTLILLLCSFINANIVHGPFKDLTGWGLTDTYFYISSIYSKPINFLLFKENYFFNAEWSIFQRLYYYLSYFFKDVIFFDPFMFFSVTLFVFSSYFINSSLRNFYKKKSITINKNVIIIFIILIIFSFPYLYYLFESPPAIVALPLIFSIFFYNEDFEKFSRNEYFFASVVLIISFFLTKFSLVLFLIPSFLFIFFKNKEIKVILLNILIIFVICVLFLFLEKVTNNIKSLVFFNNFSTFTTFKELGNFHLIHKIIQLLLFLLFIILFFLYLLYPNSNINFFKKTNNIFLYSCLINIFFYFFTYSSHLNFFVLVFQGILKFLTLSTSPKKNYFIKIIKFVYNIKYNNYIATLFFTFIISLGFNFNSFFFLYLAFFIYLHFIFFKKFFFKFFLLLLLISIFIVPKQDMVTTYDQKKLYEHAAKYKSKESIFFTDLNETIINGPINFYASITRSQYFLLNWYWDFFNSVSENKRTYYEKINKDIINGLLNPKNLDYFKEYKDFFIITFYNNKKINNFELIYNKDNYAIYRIFP